MADIARESMRQNYSVVVPVRCGRCDAQVAELYGTDLARPSGTPPEDGRAETDQAVLAGCWSPIPEHAGGPVPGYGLITQWTCPGCGERYPIRGEKIHMCFELAAARPIGAQQIRLPDDLDL